MKLLPTAIAALLGGALAAPPAARADLYTSERDGVIHITSERPRKGRLLFRLKEEPARRGSPAGARSARSPGAPLATPEAFSGFVKAAAAYYALPEALVWAVMKVESGFQPEAVSRVGALGLMQLMPGTARDMGVSDPFDPQQSIFGGARYLRILANRFNGDLVLTLSGYHAGGGAVDSVGGIPFTETAEYVRRVLNAYYAYQRQLPVAEAPGDPVAGSAPGAAVPEAHVPEAPVR